VNFEEDYAYERRQERRSVLPKICPLGLCVGTHNAIVGGREWTTIIKVKEKRKIARVSVR
jgi:hypothetical protein